MARVTTAKAAIVEASVPGAAYLAAAKFRHMAEVQLKACRKSEGNPPRNIS